MDTTTCVFTYIPIEDSSPKTKKNRKNAQFNFLNIYALKSTFKKYLEYPPIKRNVFHTNTSSPHCERGFTTWPIDIWWLISPGVFHSTRWPSPHLQSLVPTRRPLEGRPARGNRSMHWNAIHTRVFHYTLGTFISEHREDRGECIA